MNSILQWMLLTSMIAVLDDSLHLSGARILHDIYWATVSCVAADVVWWVWCFIRRREGYDEAKEVQ